jgi:hypothetical protein
MKNSTKLFVVFFLVFCFSSTAHALMYTIDNGNTDVGYLDVIKASAEAKNAKDREAFFQTVVGTDTPFSKDEGMGDKSIDPYPWVVADQSPNVVVYDFAPHFGSILPDFYLLKFGKSIESSQRSVILENVGNLQYAVIDLSAFGEKVDMYAISSITVPVPEPSTLLFLGCGLLGLGWYGRKRKKV